MTTRDISARETWRIVKLTARHMDRCIPFWWRDPAALDAALSSNSDTIIRCWQQVIRQRTGE